MKKIVVIMIVGLYIGSIFLVNFFGLNYVKHEMTFYVDKIECNTISDIEGNEIPYYKIEQDPEDGKDIKHFRSQFIPGTYTADEDSLANNGNTYKINVTVLPSNANNKTLKLSYTENTKRYVVDEEQMTVTFLKRASVVIYIFSTDGSNIEESISIDLYN